MELEIKLKEASNGLKSVRATERKKNAEVVKEFLMRNAVPCLLTDNSLTRKGYSWNHLFDDINEYILKECEKYETSKTYESVTGPLCTSLLHLCVAGSNKGRAYIKCEKIMEMCLYVLNDNRLNKAIGDCYLNLLFKHVLPCEYYLGYITPNTWKGLLEVSVAACFSGNSKLDNFTKLRLILLVLKSGNESSQFVKPVIDSLPMLEKYFNKVSSDKKVQDIITEIITLLLEMLSSEFRLTMCNFVETNIPSILKFYDQNKDQKKKTVLFKLLYLSVTLHHPLGRHQTEEGSLANNWEQWNKCLNTITELICSEVGYMQKARRHNDRMSQNYSYFYDLAPSVYFQIFKLSERTDDIEVESSSKRLRLNFNKNKTFHDLVNELQQNHIPWMGVINVYVKNYGTSISANDYSSLLNCLQTILTNNCVTLDWAMLESLTCLVLQNLNRLMYKSAEYDNVLISLWNSCIRNCTSTTSTHKAVHTIVQHLLNQDAIKNPQTQSLIKLYLEKDMPVTTHSVTTLSKMFNFRYSDCSSNELRTQCVSWLTSSDIVSISVTNITELLTRLTANENVNITRSCHKNTEYEKLRDILFNSNEKCILFSEFEIDNVTIIPEEVLQHSQIETVEVVENQVQEYFISILVETVSKLRHKDSDLIHCIKLIQVVVSYLDTFLKYNIKTRDEVQTSAMYTLSKRIFTAIYSSLNETLRSNVQITIKINALQLVKELLLTEFDCLITNMLRTTIDGDLFHTINNIINTEVQPNDNDVSIDGDEDEMNFDTLKHSCFLVLAAYCRKETEYREEILKLILDDGVYNFTTDLNCIFQVLDISTDSKVEDPAYGMVFTLLQCMCQKLYKNAKASFGILNVLVNIIDKLCLGDSVNKDNIYIMIKSYLQLCADMYYPPKVASLVYECAAKLIVVNRKQNESIDRAFEGAFMKKIKGNVHSMRLYCCYLLKLMNNSWENDIEVFTTDLLEIFLVDVSDDTNQLVLKDESDNRTFTVLHCLLALAQSNSSTMQSVILLVLNLHKTKSLNKHVVMKALNRIVKSAGIEDIKVYMNDRILSVIHYWFTNRHTVKDLLINAFCYDDLDLFVNTHKGWLVAGHILWYSHGKVTESELLRQIAGSGPIDDVLETCFPNIIALTLPYIVSEKYNVEYYPFDKRNEFKRALKNANSMFKSTCEVLKNERWSSLLVENIRDLLLFSTIHMKDCEDAEVMFEVKLSHHLQEFYYPKRIFTAILDYFESLIDESVIQCLCRDQTTTIFKILLKLWKAVMQERIFEWKVLALHAYVTFLKSIPLGFPSDAFVCNYACNSFTQAIKNCCDKNEMNVLIRGLRILLDYVLPHKASMMRKSLLELLPVLIIKKEAGYEQECSPFLNYLLNDMKGYLVESVDVVDFLNSMSQGVVDNGPSANLSVFKEKLKAHRISLNRPSHETLLNVRQFLCCNKEYINNMYCELDSKIFSEDCGTSLIHQIIHALCNILKSSCDEKTVIEACNCLSEISSYDLKTLVTAPPPDTGSITNVDPKHYFAQVTVKALLEVCFDEDPNVTNEVTETLGNLLKCIDIEDITELDETEKQILQPLSSPVTVPNDTEVDGAKFQEYYTMFPDGIFLNALLNENKNDWVKEVTCVLLEFVNSSTNYVSSLLKVCVLKSHVCRKILPALIGLLLKCLMTNATRIKAIGGHINKLFNYIYEHTFDNTIENSGDSTITSSAVETLTDGHKAIVQYMLDIVNFVRIQRNYYAMRPGSPKKCLNYLDLEYDKVAWAASVVDQNWAAIFYGELWAVFQNNDLSPYSPESTTNLPGGENLQRIFRKCYMSIGEVDAVDGCGTAHLTMENEKRKHLINSGQYSDALLLHDIALSCDGQNDLDLQYGVVRSLHKSGMHHLALRYIKSLPENDQLNDVKYECLAFLGDWSDFVDTQELEEKYKQKNYNPNSIVKAFQYACLKNCLHIQAAPEFEDKLLVPLNKAKLAVSRLCHNLNMVNCQNIYKTLEKLHMFRDLEEYFSVRSNRTELSELLQRWDVDNLPQFHDFKHIEALSSQRVLLLEYAAKSHNNLVNDVVSLQIQYAKLALNNNRVQMAQRLLATAKKSQVTEDIALVESEISWAKGHKELALSLIRNIINKPSLDDKLAAVSLRRYALWIADSKRDNPRDIINKYLQKSLNYLNRDHVDVRLKVYRDIAKFADAEYKQVVSYMNSSIFENRVKCVENMKGTESSLNNRPMKSLSKEENRALSANRKFKELDEAEIANTRAERENFLQLAMRYYLLSLKQCNDSNLSVFRVVSLWLANPDFEFSEGGTETFEDLLHSIPSWKFVTILPQLAPRLTNEDTPFINNLKKLLQRCAVDHPHHTLPILFLLKNSDKDNVITNASGRGAAARARSHEPRVLAANALVNGLRTAGDLLATIVAQMESMCDAIISFANHVPTVKSKSDTRSKLKIPDAENIHKLRNLTAIPVPTVTLPVKHDCKYSYIQTFHSFDSHYELVGGVNCPKKINCKDSSGKNHILLIKGGDDLKQDAVMQQVFNIVNTLLEKDPVTNRKKLLIRTYKVVPLSRLSGVLEWCEGTVPIGAYLVGTNNSGAHGRYRPQDISCDIARRKMIECSNENNEVKLTAYKRIVRDFKPVFNYFFTEHYLDPVTWYERRLAYTKSVATSSMVGYILGLGDRHVYNILIDQRTAEVIHIDLGIAFDQGKTLRTPETVPFRLTRDIISGFGSSGTEGIFRRCCEKTMQLLRDNQETLLTILEVLLCDPLYSWSVKTAQQNAPTTTRNNNALCTTGSPSGLAKRALLVVTSKLSGTEDGVSGGVAVPGQVARLLHAATDPFNLCRLFHGWQPYL